MKLTVKAELGVPPAAEWSCYILCANYYCLSKVKRRFAKIYLCDYEILCGPSFQALLPVVAGGPGEGVLEGGGEVEHGPGQDDVVVGAQEEGDDHRAHPRPPQDRAQPVQGACRDI